MVKKDIPSEIIDNDVISDSDDDNIFTEDLNTRDIVVDLYVDSQSSGLFQSLDSYMQNGGAQLVKSGDPTWNINMNHKQSYKVFDEKISTFMGAIDKIRATGRKQMVMEKQQEYSGIMIDLDIYQEMKESQIDRNIYELITIRLGELLKKYINLEESNDSKSNEQIQDLDKIHIIFTKKQKVLFSKEKNAYKDGVHILVPGIKIKKEVKLFLIEQFADPNSEIFKSIKVIENTNCLANIVDRASCWVPVALYGSCSKTGSEPYIASRSYTIRFKKINGKLSEPILEDITESCKFETHKPQNWCYELSLNWENPPERGGVIRKKNYDIREEYAYEVQRYIKTIEQKILSDESQFGELDLRRLYDPDTKYIMELLDCLNIQRAQEYELWLNVMCALAHSKGDCKELARYFSKKDPNKYDEHKFENMWIQIKRRTNGVVYHFGSIVTWAQQDNPDKYWIVAQRRLYFFARRKCYCGASEGNLAHYDIAELIYMCLEFKYKYCPQNKSWYEYMTEDDENIRPGEIYKWVKCHNKSPTSMANYISSILTSFFWRIIQDIRQSSQTEQDARRVKYHKKVLQGTCATYRKLKDHGFKNNVMSECANLFEDNIFLDKLDQYPNILGVGNGLLVLGEKCELLTGYHNYYQSQYTAIDWRPFNPRDPIIRKMLIAFRNLFPDDEPDTHEWYMIFRATSLDGKVKKPIFAQFRGEGQNGKTFGDNFHKHTLAKYSVEIPTAFLTGKSSRDVEGANPVLMKFKTARSAYYQETGKSEHLNTQKVKWIAGGGIISGRDLFKEHEDFQPHCTHSISCNYELIITTTDHGTWRRIYYVPFRMRFWKPHEIADYEDSNSYHRIGDEDIYEMSETGDSEYCSAYLSILSYYYEIYQSKYRGNIDSVPHHNIEVATEEYRQKQDIVSLFLSQFLIDCNKTAHAKSSSKTDNKASDDDDVNKDISKNDDDDEYKDMSKNELLIEEIRDKYVLWFSKNGFADDDFKKSAESDLRNSPIGTLLKRERNKTFLLGYRLLDRPSDDLEDNERLFKKKHKQKKVNIIPETVDQYLENIEKEWENRRNEKTKLKPIMSLKAKNELMPFLQEMKNTPREVMHAAKIPRFNNIEGVISADNNLADLQILTNKEKNNKQNQTTTQDNSDNDSSQSGSDDDSSQGNLDNEADTLQSDSENTDSDSELDDNE